ERGRRRRGVLSEDVIGICGCGGRGVGAVVEGMEAGGGGRGRSTGCEGIGGVDRAGAGDAVGGSAVVGAGDDGSGGGRRGAEEFAEVGAERRSGGRGFMERDERRTAVVPIAEPVWIVGSG